MHRCRVAFVTNEIVITVDLIGIREQRAGVVRVYVSVTVRAVASIADAIAVRVGLIDVGLELAVVARVADLIALAVRLVRVDGRDAVVANIAVCVVYGELSCECESARPSSRRAVRVRE